MRDSLFDAAYQKEGLLFGNSPSEELHEYLDAHPRTGTVLDLGCGDGRDTVPLLKRGFAVTAVDMSPFAISKLCSRSDLTSEMMHALTTHVADVCTWNWPSQTFDLIVATTVLDHVMLEEIPSIIQRMIQAAKDNALVFVEVHTVDDPAITGIGPISEFASEIRHYFGWNELIDLFRPYVRILRYTDRAEWDYDHGPAHMHGFATLLGTVTMRGEKQ